VRALAGSFKELTGLYVLTQRQDRTLIEYNARFIPEFELPKMVGMLAVQHSLERHLDGLAAEIRRRSPAPDRPKPASPAPAAPGRGE